MSLSRRALLQLAGLAALPSLSRAEGAFEGWGEGIHHRASAAPPTLFRDEERALVSAIADAIVPRTSTPGALDVGVPAFVEFITAEWMTDQERREFREGLAGLEAHAIAGYGRAWPALDPVQRDGELQWAESAIDPSLPARRAYRRLRGHVLHGYLTSQRVQREVLHVNITPGHFFGCAPVLPGRSGDA
jgi:gluconate 2-dehydrogenase gamma chain